jgi:hypothetical protein
VGEFVEASIDGKFTSEAHKIKNLNAGLSSISDPV